MTFISKRHRNVFPRWKTTCTCFFFNFFFVNSNGILRFQMYNYYQYFTLTLAISDKKTKDIQHTIKDVWYDFHVSNMYFLWQDISFYIIIWPRAVWTTLCKKNADTIFFIPKVWIFSLIDSFRLDLSFPIWYLTLWYWTLGLILNSKL